MMVLFRPHVSETFIFLVLSNYLDSKRIEQICKPNGWRKPDHVDVQCKTDGKFMFTVLTIEPFSVLIIFPVNELAEDLQILKQSLVNNNLLNSCTIQGVTNDWVQEANEVVQVTGI